MVYLLTVMMIHILLLVPAIPRPVADVIQSLLVILIVVRLLLAVAVMDLLVVHAIQCLALVIHNLVLAIHIQLADVSVVI